MYACMYIYIYIYISRPEMQRIFILAHFTLELTDVC
jgi:hypothetical protein